MLTKNWFALLESVLSAPRGAKVAVVVFCDVSLTIFATWSSFYLRLGTVEPLNSVSIGLTVFSVVLSISVLYAGGFYKCLYRHSHWSTIGSFVNIFSAYTLIYAFFVLFWGLPGIPRTLGLIQPVVLFAALIGLRLVFGVLVKFQRDSNVNLDQTSPRILIYGAGSAGNQLAGLLRSESGIIVVGFCDDDRRLHGRSLRGCPIVDPADLSTLVDSGEISHVILAMPSISSTRKRQIAKYVEQHKVIVRTLPSVSDLLGGRVSLNDLGELSILDLLGRDVIPPNKHLMTKDIDDKVILVSGAGGSIGSEICRQISRYRPKRLVMVEVNEFALYKIHGEIEQLVKNICSRDRVKFEVVPILASIQNAKKVESIFRKFKPNTVYHAAAYKHVAMAENNVGEVIRNNVLSTAVIAEVAIACRVQKVILVSTDKAVRPTSLMGASKRLAEMILQAKQVSEDNSETCFAIVRFGNVLGSSGSVIPKFEEQISRGGPITVTHPDVTRYFMTIPEAAQLVIQASAIARGGEVFLLDMGSPIKILDLAKKMIRLSGLAEKTPETKEGDIEIKITGLQPGEKLFEELLIDDNPTSTEHRKIFKAEESYIPWNVLKEGVRSLQGRVDASDDSGCLELVKLLVKGYGPSESQNSQYSGHSVTNAKDVN